MQAVLGLVEHHGLRTVDHLVGDFVAAMRARDTFAFKQRLRGADLLLIDDLQFIAGKDATQEEFFHTVNEIMSAGMSVLVISHEPFISALTAYLLGVPAMPSYRTAQCCAIQDGKPLFTARADLGTVQTLFV